MPCFLSPLLSVWSFLASTTSPTVAYPCYFSYCCSEKPLGYSTKNGTATLIPIALVSYLILTICTIFNSWSWCLCLIHWLIEDRAGLKKTNGIQCLAENSCAMGNETPLAFENVLWTVYVLEFWGKMLVKNLWKCILRSYSNDKTFLAETSCLFPATQTKK